MPREPWHPPGGSPSPAEPGFAHPGDSLPLGGLVDGLERTTWHASEPPAADNTPRTSERAAGVTGVLVSIGIVIGTLGEWVRVTRSAQMIAGTGWSNVNGNPSWGPAFVVVALAGVAVALLTLRATPNPRLRGLGFVIGGVALAGAIGQLVDIWTADTALNATVGWGIWLILGCSAVLAIIPIAYRRAGVSHG